MSEGRTMTRPEARRHLLRKHACTAWCRGAEHVEVVWHTSADPDLVTVLAERLCDLLGVALVRLVRASPEARPPQDCAVLTAAGKQITIAEVPIRGECGYLMTWRAG